MEYLMTLELKIMICFIETTVLKKNILAIAIVLISEFLWKPSMGRKGSK